MILINLFPAKVLKKRAFDREYKQRIKVERDQMSPEQLESVREADRKYARLYRENNREAHRESSRESVRRWRYKKFNFTVEDYDRMVIKQGDRCACCDCLKPEDMLYWCVDHDHVTNRVRGLICNNCNGGIGFLGDSVEGVRKALTYLERHYGVGSR